MMYDLDQRTGSPQVRRAQDPNDYAGKIVRLRDDGTFPSDNPFVERVGYKPGIYTMGHRNGHGLAANPETGEMWETEQGPSGGDEVDILRPGHKVWLAGREFRTGLLGPVSRHPFRSGMEDPSVVWLPSIGLTGMTFYTGNRFRTGSATCSSAVFAREGFRARSDPAHRLQRFMAGTPPGTDVDGLGQRIRDGRRGT